MLYLKRLLYLAVAVLVLFSLSAMLQPSKVFAGELEPRSWLLESTTTTGGSDPGGTVNYLFNFTVPTLNTTITGIQFQFCEVADGTCGNLNTDYAFSTTTSTLGAGTSASLSGFTLTNTTQGTPYISSATGYDPTTNAQAAFAVEIDHVVNPNIANYTFYARITTWQGGAPGAGGASVIDSGNVAAATATPIQLNGTMPESLVFCTGATVGMTGGVPDCTTATAGTVTFSQLFSPTYTDTATSQMAASTNAGSGYAITVEGQTLTSGTNTITAIGAAATSPVKGTSQFGMNLVLNTTATANPAPGAAIAPASDGSNYFALPTTNYATADKYAFVASTSSTVTPTTVATSGYPTGSPTVGTDAQIYTATYIVNVPGRQPAGTYTTTLTYVCTATF